MPTDACQFFYEVRGLRNPAWRTACMRRIDT